MFPLAKGLQRWFGGPSTRVEDQSPQPCAEPTLWQALSEQQQLALQQAYGFYLDKNPQLCGCDRRAKARSFTVFLQRYRVIYPEDERY
ncbi:hypothetical protein [Magnetococcus marinus]|uniref:hypothetical protein n=1 Tax=Magnetococcus marinus TaxID=1124597 RepID=UPI00117E1DFF|nr:hypothetical protein [Magnetococcus marinus]